MMEAPSNEGAFLFGGALVNSRDSSGLEEIMGDALVQRMLPSFAKIPLPVSAEATSLGRTTYEVGIEKVNQYKNDPKVLAEALRTFQTGDSQPYFFAGLAYTLVAAAREADGSYAQSGLEAAMEWLEKAQALAPDELDINVIEALVYIYSGRFEDARLILDYLEEQDPNCFYLMEAEVAFWQTQGDQEQTIQAYQKAISEAANVPQRLRMQNRLGEFYQTAGVLDKALAVYREAVHFDKENPWLWHNISTVFFKLDNTEEAARANKRTLALLDFPEARQLEQAIKAKTDAGGSKLGRLFGR
jgi:tetratricopeptide (TPR) repeat protein